MLVPVSQISTILKDYIMEAMLPKAPTTIEKASLGFVIPFLPNIVNKLYTSNKDKFKLLGILDDKEENINLELAVEGAKSSLKVLGGKYIISNMSFDASDVDTISTIAQKYGIQDVQPITPVN